MPADHFADVGIEGCCWILNVGFLILNGGCEGHAYADSVQSSVFILQRKIVISGSASLCGIGDFCVQFSVVQDLLRFGLGEQQCGHKGNGEYSSANEAGGNGDGIKSGFTADHRRDDIGGEECSRGAEHATSDIRGKTAARAAQMKGKNFGQVFPKITELRHDHKATKENAPFHSGAGLMIKNPVRNRKQNEPREDKQTKKSLVANGSDQQQRQQNSSKQSPAFLVALHHISTGLDGIVERLLGCAII